MGVHVIRDVAEVRKDLIRRPADPHLVDLAWREADGTIQTNYFAV
jgi:hypothetical protein